MHLSMQTLQYIQVTKVMFEGYSMLLFNIPIPDKEQRLTWVFTFFVMLQMGFMMGNCREVGNGKFKL